MKTKPRGIHATFRTDCHCGQELTVTNGRPDPHDCRPPERKTIQDALADYYVYGDPPKHQRLEDIKFD